MVQVKIRTLNKSNLTKSLYLIYLMFLLLVNCFLIKLETKGNVNFEELEVQIVPPAPSLGDTISVKVKRDKNKTNPPKIFFYKSKVPVFALSDSFYRSLIPISANFKAGDYPLEIYYLGKAKKIDLVIKDKKYPIESLTLKKEVAALRATRFERQQVAKALSTVSSKKFWNGKFIFPSDARQSTCYGVKRKINGVIDPDYFHKGLDFAANTGDKVVSPEDGKIILAGRQTNSFVVNGNCIFIDHGHGVVSGYLHLSELLVKEGGFVNKGQIIGKVGSTGIASGPHLHWGIYVFGKTVDPLVWTNMTIE